MRPYLALAFALAAFGCAGDSVFGAAGAGASSGGDGGAGADGMAGSSSAGGMDAQGGSAASGGSGGLDLDLDGIDDLAEEALALQSLPFLSIHPDDECPRAGVLYRASPHPDDGAWRMIWFVTLFERDCGFNGHVGDDEVFGVVVDPAGAVVALRAISHQGTACQKITSCGSLPGCDACTTSGPDARPVTFFSRDKHGSYVNESSCDQSFGCDFGGCQLAATAAALPLVNAGEPSAPLVTNLTTQGFINEANGWTERALMDFDPWSDSDFGSAGNVTSDLQDAAFVIAPAGCEG